MNNDDRDKRIVDLRNEGKTFIEIGQIVDLTPTRVSQICRKASPWTYTQVMERIRLLEAVIVKADEQLHINEGIGLLGLLGKLPEAEIVRGVLEKADAAHQKSPSTETEL